VAFPHRTGGDVAAPSQYATFFAVQVDARLGAGLLAGLKNAVTSGRSAEQ
jgi:hypothetical protein